MRVVHDTGRKKGAALGKKAFSQGDVTDRPCAAVLGASTSHHYRVEGGGGSMSPAVDIGKPPYFVPLVRSVSRKKCNGLTVASTFAGCGGSSYGYRMAGYSVAYANEFDAIPADSYELNSKLKIDRSDIRTVTGDKIRKLSGIKEFDVLDGSPPCQPFSTAGKREKGWHKKSKHGEKEQEAAEDLFFEYVRLIRELSPRCFVAENVSGLVKGKCKGYFKEILREMRKLGYRVQARVLDAQWLGVPQSRQRVIFIGIREDLGKEPIFPKPLSYRYSVRNAIGNLVCARDGKKGWKSGDEPSPTLSAGVPYGPMTTSQGMTAAEFSIDISRYAIGREWNRTQKKSAKYLNLTKANPNEPSPTVTYTGGIVGAASVTHGIERRKFTIAELKRICAFPDDFRLCGSYEQQWGCLGNAVPPVMMYYIARVLRDKVLKEKSR